MLPLAAVVVPLVDFVIGLPCCSCVMAVYGTWPDSWAVLLAPAFLALAVVTALGIGFLLSTLTARWRDVPYMIPVFLQILPLVSGVMYALDQIPEKWQWIFSLNPMSAVIAGWRWAILGETEPQLGPDGGERRRRDPALRRAASPSSAASSRASRTRSDGARDRSAGALEALPHRPDAGRVRDAARLALAHRRSARRPRRRAATAAGDLGAARRELQRPRRRGARRDRAQRRRQVDAAQDPDADHDADDRAARSSAAASAACSRSAPASTPS